MSNTNIPADEMPTAAQLRAAMAAHMQKADEHRAAGREGQARTRDAMFKECSDLLKQIDPLAAYWAGSVGASVASKAKRATIVRV